MRQILYCAGVLLALAPASWAQSIEFRIVERFNDTYLGPADASPTSSPTTIGHDHDRTLWFVVQARVSGLDPQAFNGITSFQGSIDVTAGAGSGTFKVAGTDGTPPGNPTNRSPVNFFPPGTSSNGFLTTGVALYAPFRLISGFGVGNGSVVDGDHSSLRTIVGATSLDPLDLLESGELSAAVWGVDAWTNVYAFQYDVLSLGWQELRFETNFYESLYFNGRNSAGNPNAIPFESQTQGSYSIVVIPAPKAAALLGLGGLVAGRRRRA